MHSVRDSPGEYQDTTKPSYLSPDILCGHVDKHWMKSAKSTHQEK